MHFSRWSDEFDHTDRIRGNERKPYAPGRTKAARKPDGSEEFKCRHCRAFVGPTVSGGRHRNHCPICLHSRHVDRSHPGDRASACRSLMPAIGTFFKLDGEQMILHRCAGCGVERHNRIAADDSSVALLHLPLVPPRYGKAARQRTAGQIAS
jgi:hypothetical protein